MKVASQNASGFSKKARLWNKMGVGTIASYFTSKFWFHYVSEAAFSTFEEPTTQTASRSFLQKIWKHPSASVKLRFFILVIFYFLYAFVRKGRLLTSLSQEQKSQLLSDLLTSRFSFLVMAGHALRVYGLMAMFSSEEARKTFFQEPEVQKNKPLRQIKPSPPLSWIADYLVIGSGPAGSIAASRLAEKGNEVFILEEGDFLTRKDFQPDALWATRYLMREFAQQRTTSGISILQGRAVGGSSVVSGAIMERLPLAVYNEWAEDSELASAIPYSALEREFTRIERELEIGSPLAILLPKLPIHQALNELGWQHTAMTRAASQCQASGRCYQGCPSGAKLSMENSYLSQPGNNIRILPGHRVKKILFAGERADAVLSVHQGRSIRIEARKGILLAAGAIHSPTLLWRSGVDLPELGKNFQCHLSSALSFLMNESVLSVTGPPQGIEVTQFEPEGFRMATQLLPPELLLARSNVAGSRLEALLHQTEKIASWMVSIRAEAFGELRFRLGMSPKIDYWPSSNDLQLIKKGTEKLQILSKKLGAQEVFPSSLLGAGHLFGGCRIGSRNAVVRPDFSVVSKTGLYCIDASLFPSNIGVHPQQTILALASFAAGKISG